MRIRHVCKGFGALAGLLLIAAVPAIGPSAGGTVSRLPGEYRTVWVTDRGLNNVSAFDAGTGQVLATIPAKAAVLSFTRSLAVDWGGHGVRVNAICPGAVDTAVNNRHLVGKVALADMPAELIPLNRWSRPDDLVGTAIWLASDASSYVTGAVIDVGGGMFLSFPKEWLAKLDQVVEERPNAGGLQAGSDGDASESFSVDM